MGLLSIPHHLVDACKLHLTRRLRKKKEKEDKEDCCFEILEKYSGLNLLTSVTQSNQLSFLLVNSGKSIKISPYSFPMIRLKLHFFEKKNQSKHPVHIYLYMYD